MECKNISGNIPRTKVACVYLMELYHLRGICAFFFLHCTTLLSDYYCTYISLLCKYTNFHGNDADTFLLDGTKDSNSYNILFPFNLLKPIGYVMHQQFNIQQLYVLPTLYLCVLYLSENKQRLVPLIALTDWFL